MRYSSGYLKLLAFAICTTFIISSCQKDPNDPNGSGGAASGRFSGHMSCAVIATPTDVGLNAYYTKYYNCGGIPIVGSDSISDEALMMADQTIAFMLKGLDDVKVKLIQAGAYYALSYSDGLALNNLPELNGEPAERGGKYQGDGPIAVSSEDNLLCLPTNRAKGTSHFVHEMVHMIHDAGLRRIHKNFESELQAAYNNAKSKGLWKNTYAISASQEYLACGTSIWYGVQKQGAVGGDGWSNEIYTREGLQNYDPQLYQLIAKYFNDETDVPGCVKPVVTTTTTCVPTVTDIDGNVYSVVAIGSQCWMKENLKTSRLRDGTPIDKIDGSGNWWDNWDNVPGPAYIYYDHKESNNTKYGKLYNWLAASNAKICPEGWHIPTNAEWEQMMKQTDGINNSKHLKAVNEWNNADNKSGFSVLPAGGVINAEFKDMGTHAYFWSSQIADPPFQMLRLGVKIYADKPTELGGFLPEYGFSCRCVKD